MHNTDGAPKRIKIHGARVHNLKNINVEIPLNQIVGIGRSFRFREIVSGAGRCVCRRLQTVSGIALDLHQTADDRCGEGTGG